MFNPSYATKKATANGYGGGMALLHVFRESGAIKGRTAMTYADGNLYLRGANGVMLLVEASPRAARRASMDNATEQGAIANAMVEPHD